MARLSIGFLNKVCQVKDFNGISNREFRVEIEELRDFKRNHPGDKEHYKITVYPVPLSEFDMCKDIQNPDGFYKVTLLNHRTSEVIESRVGYMGRRDSGNQPKIDLACSYKRVSGKFKVTLQSNVCLNTDIVKDIVLKRDDMLIPIPSFTLLQKSKTFKYGISFLIPGGHAYKIEVNELLAPSGIYNQNSIQIC